MTLNTFINRLLVFTLTVAVSTGVLASDHGKEKEEEFNTAEFALHHVQDAHEYHLFGDVSIPLPVILIADGGLVVFSSSAFEHGEKVVEKGGKKFALHHGKIYQLNSGESHLKFDHETHEVKNAVKPLDFSITKNVLTLFIVAGLMLWIFMSVAKSYKTNDRAPKGLAAWMEPLVIFVRDDIAVPNIGHKYGKFMPYLLTVFFFIWIGNLLGLIPLIANPNLTGSFSVAMTLAAFTLVIQLMNANAGFWSHIFMPPGMPKILWLILVPIEFAGIFIKAGALTIRLFANITAGHIIVISLVSIIFVNKSMAWSGLSVPMTLFISALELLVAALQAYIFTMLSALFIGQAVEDAHH